jgi:hypothetical protein
MRIRMPSASVHASRTASAQACSPTTRAILPAV